MDQAVIPELPVEFDFLNATPEARRNRKAFEQINSILNAQKGEHTGSVSTDVDAVETWFLGHSEVFPLREAARADHAIFLAWVEEWNKAKDRTRLGEELPPVFPSEIDPQPFQALKWVARRLEGSSPNLAAILTVRV
jgi:hypothetical protein